MPVKRRKLDDYLPGEVARQARGEHSTRGPGRGGEELELLREIAAGIARIEVDLAGIKREIEALRSMVEDLSKAISSLQRRASMRVGRGGAAGEDSPLADLLEEEGGLVFASEVRQKLKMSLPRLMGEAKRIGAIVLDAGGDVAIMTREAYSGFLRALREAQTSDPEEAARGMGPYERLFTLLRREGQVYYDARRGHWVLLR